MRKWTYLVATLLMAGTTATFTGCIDTDEPEGIAELRGAKSELIKAQAAVRLVEVEWQKAQVANQELVNKAKELSNQYQEYDNQMHALDVKLKELEVERAQAATEREKAEAEAKIAQANRDKAFWENKMAEEAEIFKASLLTYQTATAQAQEAYDNAMKLIEAGKLLLTDGEKAIINKAQLHLENAATAMTNKYESLKNAQIAYNTAITEPETPTLESLQALVKQAQVAVEKNEILLKEKENLLALAEDFDAAEWDAKYLEMKKKMSEYQSLQDKAEVEKVRIEQSADYKTAEQKLTDKKELKKTAQKAYYDENVTPETGAKADSIAATLTNRTIKEYKSEPVNNGLKALFVSETSFDNIGYDKATGVFSYSKGTYTQKAYDADLKDKEEAARTNDASVRIMTVKKWITTLTDYTVDANGVAWNEQQKAKLVEKAKKAGDIFNTTYDYWNIAVKAYTDETKATPTQPIADLKKATDEYNTAYTLLNKAITDYNTAYDKVYQAAYDKKITELKDKETLRLYLSAFNNDQSRLSTYNTKFPASVTATDAERIEFIKLQILAKAEYEAKDKEVVKYLATDAVINIAKSAASTAWAPSKDKTDAEKALAEANGKVKKAIAAIPTAINTFKTSDYENTGKLSIAIPYGQEVVNVDYNTKKITGNDGSATAFYEDEKKENVATGHKKAIVSDIAADEFTKLTETKVNENIAKAAITATSNVAFGNTILTTGNTNNDRLKPVTEDMIRAYVASNSSVQINEANFGKLGAKIEADDTVEDCTAKIEAAETIKKEITLFEGVLANLNAEIEANTALMDPFIANADKARAALTVALAEVKKAKDERDALTADVIADIAKYKGLVSSYQTLSDEIQEQIKGIKNNVSLDTDMPVTVESILNYWKQKVAEQEYIVEVNKQALAAAEKNVDLFKDNEYTQAYVVTERKIALDAATAIYNAALDVYKDALAEVKAVIEALTK